MYKIISVGHTRTNNPFDKGGTAMYFVLGGLIGAGFGAAVNAFEKMFLM
jgi:hypothetical protein